MSLLLSTTNLNKTMGSKLLFENLSLGLFEREKVGLIGPNGSGKSTLLKIIAGVDAPDNGEINYRKSIKIAHVLQETPLPENEKILPFLTKYLQEKTQADSLDAEVQASIYLSIADFKDTQMLISTLSGGWRKRLSIVMAIAQEPDLLILDEPTNHMDWDGILWLENWLKSYKNSLLLVSHDRTFLNNLTNRTIEINTLYRDGYLSFNCNYEHFLEKKNEYIQAQINQQESLSNKARREVDWLKAGVKARTTKSQSRIKEAHQLLDDLSLIKERNRSVKNKARVEIDSTDRKTKKLIEFTDLTLAYGENVLVSKLNIKLGPKMCLGLLGKNGSGKTSLLKAITGQNKNFTGSIFKADQLQVVYFDQKREALPQDINLIDYLGDGSDYTLFKGQSVHVASYASRFLFSSDKMQLKISQLSGGEQARLLIAKLLLNPADVLILDEPTNDLDIDTIEILEETLANFDGLIILVSHDRYFLKQLSHQFLSLNGNGSWCTYSDLEQWLRDQSRSDSANNTTPLEKPKSIKKNKVKLSYKEKVLLENIESEIEAEEKNLLLAQNQLLNEEVLANHELLKKYSTAVAKHQESINQLYSLWDELEAKKNNQQQ